jgi:hypothetical protein
MLPINIVARIGQIKFNKEVQNEYRQGQLKRPPSCTANAAPAETGASGSHRKAEGERVTPNAHPQAKILDEAKETHAEKSLEKMKGENPLGSILNLSV